jgi:hypothetical protein
VAGLACTLSAVQRARTWAADNLWLHDDVPSTEDMTSIEVFYRCEVAAGEDHVSNKNPPSRWSISLSIINININPFTMHALSAHMHDSSQTLLLHTQIHHNLHGRNLRARSARVARIPLSRKTLKALLRLDLFSSSSSSIFPHRLMKPPFSHLSVPCFYNRHPSNEPTSLVSKPWWKAFFSLCRY